MLRAEPQVSFKRPHWQGYGRACLLRALQGGIRSSSSSSSRRSSSSSSSSNNNNTNHNNISQSGLREVAMRTDQKADIRPVMSTMQANTCPQLVVLIVFVDVLIYLYFSYMLILIICLNTSPRMCSGARCGIH